MTKRQKLTRSNALVEAQAKYHKEKTRQYGVRFCVSKDADIIDFIENNEKSKLEIFRESIRDYMNKQK